MAGLTDDLGFLLSRASGLVVRATNAALSGEGLRVRQYSVLALAADSEDGISQRDLAEVLGLDPSQVVLLVDELAAAGFVERRPSPTDRRTKLVAATAPGRSLRERAGVLEKAALQAQLTALSDEDRSALRALLTRVIAEDPE
jgi:DNA-binding MarR family transcriptional regulator